ncbi:MoaD/ThiS family protein [Aliikangiella coralliicola]|uniref:MoaD/ThiS family protein n=1 Tax=Aliikangiella coralliicola TaxID=2592383 RepID=A0A545UIR4_9GAMM|nr:MoaD/ThiS family protein [Aliikangiella coralliicola]TQV89356.1 MoaD/ThiS family protein [Aliikangiella coralliicola]
MPKVIFTDNLKRHIDCPPQLVNGATVRETLDQVFEQFPQLGCYILDDQRRLRKHILVSVDNVFVEDRVNLTDLVKPDSEVYVLQALSGG